MHKPQSIDFEHPNRVELGRVKKDISSLRYLVRLHAERGSLARIHICPEEDWTQPIVLEKKEKEKK